MNREDIIAMAREAGFTSGEIAWHDEMFKRFAALVAAAEREACAKVVEDCSWPRGAEHPYDTREVFSAAIRARGQE